MLTPARRKRRVMPTPRAKRGSIPIARPRNCTVMPTLPLLRLLLSFIAGPRAYRFAGACDIADLERHASHWGLRIRDLDVAHFEELCSNLEHVRRPYRRNFSLALNARSHVTPSACAHLGSLLTKSCPTTEGAPSDAATTVVVDWHARQALTPVKDQGACGSCWAEAVVAVAETQLYLQDKTLIRPQSLAVQPLLDCDNADRGCGGGDPLRAADFLRRNGDCADARYPYASKVQGTCLLADKSRLLAPGLLRAHVLPPSDAHALAHALRNGPLVVTLAAASRDFQLYAGGVFDGDCSSENDHAVVLVGVAPSYWILRNSWGRSWGEGGYMRMEKATAERCGLLLTPLALALG